MNWIPLAKGTLPPTTPHPKILVTNNLPACAGRSGQSIQVRAAIFTKSGT